MDFLKCFTSEYLLQSQGFADTLLSDFLNRISLLVSFDRRCEDIDVILVLKLINFTLTLVREVTFWVDLVLVLNKDLIIGLFVFAISLFVSIVFFLCGLLGDFLFWLIGGDWLIMTIRLLLRRRLIFVSDSSRSQIGTSGRSYNLGYLGFPFFILALGLFVILLKLHFFNILNFVSYKVQIQDFSD